ncbi:MAG: type II-A CRISPR-associated protein Csn2 [Hornefia sp.]|nr:type II-A CRISPR-associated protein Csn2 [Hornefia sp.]
MNFLFAEHSIDWKLESKTGNHLIIENPYVIDCLVNALKNRVLKIDDKIVLYEDEPIDFNKSVQVCFSPVDLIFEKKEIQKKLFAEMKEAIETTEISSQFIEAQTIFLETLQRLRVEMDYEIDVEEDLGIEFLLKAFNVHLKNPEGNFSQRLIEYIVDINRILRKKVFIFVGCQAYIGIGDMQSIIEQLAYEEIYVLFIDGYQNFDLLEIGNHYIIDRDMCEIH